MLSRVLDPYFVPHVLDARHVLHDVLGQALLIAVFHCPAQSHFPIIHLDFDFRGVDIPVPGQLLVDILADALIGPLIPPGSTPDMTAGLTLAIGLRTETAAKAASKAACSTHVAGLTGIPAVALTLANIH